VDESDALEPVAERSGEKTMGFLDHLEELRWTLVKCAIVVVGFAVLSGVFLTQVRHFLEWPWTVALAGYPELGLQLRTDTPMEVYGVMVQICVTPALVAASPFILYFIGQFVGPALSPKEKRVVLPGVVAGVLLFLLGASFSFLLLVPASIRVAIEANQWMGYAMIWTVGSYYSLMTWLVVGMGAVFEFPLLVLALTYLGIVSVATFRRSRRLVIVICFVAAAVITPTPDPITQTLVAAPLWLLFEIALLVGAIVERRRAKAEKAEAFDWRKTYGQ
jgi:sec-independent protein translocase protein TatC